MQQCAMSTADHRRNHVGPAIFHMPGVTQAATTARRCRRTYLRPRLEVSMRVEANRDVWRVERICEVAVSDSYTPTERFSQLLQSRKTCRSESSVPRGILR